MRVKVLNEHEESTSMTNPFHDLSKEQRQYMAEVRRRNNEAAYERVCDECDCHGGKTVLKDGTGLVWFECLSRMWKIS